MSQIQAEMLPSDPPRPVPGVMDEQDVALYLRLPDLGPVARRRQLLRLRKHRGLPAVRIGNAMVYPREVVDRWLMTQAGGLMEDDQ